MKELILARALDAILMVIQARLQIDDELRALNLALQPLLKIGPAGEAEISAAHEAIVAVQTALIARFNEAAGGNVTPLRPSPAPADPDTE